MAYLTHVRYLLHSFPFFLRKQSVKPFIHSYLCLFVSGGLAMAEKDEAARLAMAEKDKAILCEGNQKTIMTTD